MRRGSIYNLNAYLQAKQLNHTGWNVLPRNITPSDIDACIDNKGRILFIEYSSKTSLWRNLQAGQRILNENIVRNGSGKHASALCHINVDPEKEIDSIKDVVSFSFMLFKDGELITRGPFDGKLWLPYARAWLRL